MRFNRRSKRFRRLCLYIAIRTFLGVLLLPFVPSRPAHAYVSGAAADSTMGAFMENLINWKATQLGTYTAGEAAAMPAALDVGVGSFVTEGLTGAATAAAVGTPIGWLALGAVAAGVGIGAGATYCITQGCSLSWLFGSSGQVSQPENNGPDITKGAQYFTAAYGNVTYFGSAPDDAFSAMVAQLNTNAYGGDTTWQGAVATTGTCNATNGGKCYALTTKDGKVAGATVAVNGSASGTGFQGSCAGVSAATAISSSGCTGGVSPTMINGPIGDPVTEAQMVPLKYGAVTVAPNVLADVANESWRLAAAQQGYQGLPYSTGTKITAQDVTAYEQTVAANTVPTVASMVAPVANPGTVTAPQTAGGAKTMTGTVSLPSETTQGGTATTSSPGSSTSGSTSTGTSSSSSSQALPPCGNLAAGEPACEVDWNQSGASLPTAPTVPVISTILQPLLTLSNLSFWKTWQAPSSAGSCPQPSITWQSKTYQIQWCSMFENYRGIIGATENLCYTIFAFLIVFGA